MIMENLTELDVDANMEIKVIIKNWGVKALTGFDWHRVVFGSTIL